MTYFIGFFRYDDSKVWNRTGLYTDEKTVKEYLDKLQYIDKKSINIRAIDLPK